MSFISIVSNFIYHRKLPEHEEIKKQLVPKILELEEVHKNNNIGLENAYTSYSNDKNEELDETKFLKDDHIISPIVRQSIKEVIDHMRQNHIYPLPKYRGFTIGKSWYTRYNADGNFQYHTHESEPFVINGQVSQNVFSVIYILNDQNIENSTVFRTYDRNYLPISDYTEIDTGDIHDLKEGSILIFPATFHHKVKPIKIPNRITISYNVIGLL